MHLLVPKQFVASQQAGRDVIELMARFADSSESFHTRYANASFQMSAQYWTVVLICEAERSSNPGKFLLNFLMKEIDNDLGLKFPGIVAAEILKTSLR